MGSGKLAPKSDYPIRDPDGATSPIEPTPSPWTRLPVDDGGSTRPRFRGGACSEPDSEGAGRHELDRVQHWAETAVRVGAPRMIDALLAVRMPFALVPLRRRARRVEARTYLFT